VRISHICNICAQDLPLAVLEWLAANCLFMAGSVDVKQHIVLHCIISPHSEQQASTVV